MVESGDLVEVARARLRLAMRAERAFGVDAVEGVGALDVEREAHAVDIERESNAPQAEPLHAGEEKPAFDLFGNPVVKQTQPETEDAFPDPPPPRKKRIELLQALDDNEVKGCTKCELHEGRTHTVFGEGDSEAQLMFIGEGPGENEDLTGRPFVGKAGGLLGKMIAGMGLQREDVFIANVVKCRPPNNRVPTAHEVATCTPYLEKQIEWIRPKVIITLGLPATKHMLKLNLPMGKMRGQWYSWRGIRVMPTYHPAYLLRSYTKANRAAVWSDLKQAMDVLGLTPPSPK